LKGGWEERDRTDLPTTPPSAVAVRRRYDAATTGSPIVERSRKNTVVPISAGIQNTIAW
jgi:hypothetical protein